MSKKDAVINLTDSFAGAKLSVTNPETGDSVSLSLAPSMTREVESAFYGEDDE